MKRKSDQHAEHGATLYEPNDSVQMLQTVSMKNKNEDADDRRQDVINIRARDLDLTKERSPCSDILPPWKLLPRSPLYSVRHFLNSSSRENKIVIAVSGSLKPVSKIIFTIEVSRRWVHVKSVHVLEAYRGKGLGAILFMELFALVAQLGIPQIRLEAEEDTQRHDRLLLFYKELGFSIREGASILYISHDDSTTYRKIPMCRPLKSADLYFHSSFADSDFVLIRMRSKKGEFIHSNRNGVLTANANDSEGGREGQWILLQESFGYVCFESAKYGRFLCAEPDGKVVADRQWDDSWEHFFMEPCSAPFVEYSGNADNEICKNAGMDCDLDDWFALRTHHGEYLYLDEDLMTISCTPERVLWRSYAQNGVCQCEGRVREFSVESEDRKKESISKRQLSLQEHLKRMRERNSVSYIESKLRGREKEQHLRCSLWDVFDALRKYNCPLAIGLTVTHIELLILTAQDLLSKGEPEYVAAIGLIHGLGRILCVPNFFSDKKLDSTEFDDYDSGMAEYSWVVGAPFPSSICCRSYNQLNLDVENPKYCEGTGCYTVGTGLESCMLTWTGPEYLYQVLKRGGCTIPIEGLAMLRYYPLEPWHAGGAYINLSNSLDISCIDGVRRFDASRRATLRSVTHKHREVDVDEALKILKPIVNQFVPNQMDW